MKIDPTRSAGCALVTGLMTATAALADSAPQAGTLEEIVVTATKREQRLQDVPGSIVAETAEDLQRRGAVSLQDIISNTPGLSNPGTSPNQSVLVIRGIATGTGNGLKQGTVSLLYDDIPIDPGAAGAGTTNLRVVDVARVEVLRGPQGTLFGSGSLSGAIRYVTNAPDLSKVTATGELNAGSIQGGDALYSGTFTLNLPLVDERLGLRASVWKFREGGWVNDLFSGRNNVNDTDTKGGRLKLRYKPSDRLTADLSVAYQVSEDGSGFESLYDGGPSGRPDSFVSDGINPMGNRTRNALANLTLDWELGAMSLLSSTTYHERRYRLDGVTYGFVPLTTFLNFVIFNPAQNPPFINGPATFLYYANNDVFTQEFRLASTGSGPLKWTVGAFYLHADNPSSQQNASDLVTPFVGGPNIVDATVTGTQEEIAAFGSVTYTFADAWDLTLGARASRTKLDFDVVTGGWIPVFTVDPAAYTNVPFKDTSKPFTPHVSLSYRPTPDATFYVAAARGFRIGGINSTSGVGGRQTPPTYGSDSLWNYEVGVKGRGLDGRLSYAATAYYIDWKNIQIDLQNNIGNYTGNAGRAKPYGVELQADVKATERVQLGGSLTLSKNEVKEDVPGLVTATGPLDVKSGDALPSSPTRQASAYADFSFPAFGRGSYLRLSGNHVGKQWTSFGKAGSRFGGYTTADLRVGTQFGSIEFVAWCTNLFDSQGRTSASEAQLIGPVSLGGQYQWTVRPRTVGVTLRTSW